MSNEQPDDIPSFPPCRVCGESGAGFHYGVNTCEACKGFFHRSLKFKHLYKCTGRGNCDLKKVKKRRTCQLCRYNKCISVGMSREAIKTGRYTSEKKTKDILELKKLKEDITHPESPQTIPPTPEVTPAFTEQEHHMEYPQTYIAGFVEPEPARPYHETLTPLPFSPFTPSPSASITSPNCLGVGPQDSELSPTEGLTSVAADNMQQTSTESDVHPFYIDQYDTPPRDCHSYGHENKAFYDQSSVSERVMSPFMNGYGCRDPSLGQSYSHLQHLEGSHCEWGSYQVQATRHSSVALTCEQLRARDIKHDQGSPDLYPHPIPVASTGFEASPTPMATPTSTQSPESYFPLRNSPGDFASKTPFPHKVSPNECLTIKRNRQRNQRRLNESMKKLCLDLVAKYQAKISAPDSADTSDSDCDVCQDSFFPSVHVKNDADPAKLHEVMQMYYNKEEAIQGIVKAREVCMDYILSKTRVIMDPLERRRALLDHVENCAHRTDIFGPMEYLPDHVYDDIWNKTGIDADGRKAILDQWQIGTENMVTALVRFSKHLPGFRLLDRDTQADLIKSARIEFNMMMDSQFYDTELKSGMVCGCGFIFCPREVGQMYHQGYYSYFSACALRIQQLRLTDAERSIIEALIVFTTDRNDMRAPSALAASIHWELVQCLRCLLARRTASPDLLLAKVVACLTELRTAQDYAQEAMVSGMKALKYTNLLENPLMREVLSNVLEVCQKYPDDYGFLIEPFYKQGVTRPTTSSR